MSVYPEALLDHLGREVTTTCHCWRLTRKDGQITGYTDHDRPLQVDGCSFEPESGFAASEARETLGLSVDTVDVEGVLSSERIAGADIAAGLYDGARVETFLVNWRMPQQFALIRTATIGKIVRRDDSFVAELESLTRALDQHSARYVTRLCDAELGDSRCTFALDQPGFSGSGLVAAVGPAETIRVSGLGGFEAGWFSGGVLSWTAGAWNGRTERVVEHRLEAGGVTLLLQPRSGRPIEIGAAFSIVAGCDKRFATCKTKFANTLNFRGFPHLPGNDVAYGYASDGGIFDGGPVVP